jgi:hypothetical protein
VIWLWFVGLPPVVAIVATVVAWPWLHREGARSLGAALVAVAAMLPGALLVAESTMHFAQRNNLPPRYNLGDQHFLGVAALGLLFGPGLFVVLRLLAPVEGRRRPLTIVIRLCQVAWGVTALHTLICVMSV